MVGLRSAASVIHAGHPLRMRGLIAGNGIGDVHVDPVAGMLIGNDVDLVGCPYPRHLSLLIDRALDIEGVAGLARYRTHHERSGRHDDHLGATIAVLEAFERLDFAVLGADFLCLCSVVQPRDACKKNGKGNQECVPTAQG